MDAKDIKINECAFCEEVEKVILKTQAALLDEIKPYMDLNIYWSLRKNLNKRAQEYK